MLGTVIKCEKWTDQHDASVEQIKKSESPTGIEPTTSWTPGSALKVVVVPCESVCESTAVLILAVCRRPVTHELGYTTLPSSVLVAQWIERPPDVLLLRNAIILNLTQLLCYSEKVNLRKICNLALLRQANILLVKVNNAKSTNPPMSSGEECGLLSWTAAGNLT